MPEETFTHDREKTKEAVIYLCQQSLDDANFGVSKMTKLLYFADMNSYRHLGKPITGNRYLHFPHGPHPAEWYDIRREMEKAGDIEVLHHDLHRYYYHYWIIPLREPTPGILNDTEIRTLDEVLLEYAQETKAGIEQRSRWEVAWRATEDGEPLDYRKAGFTAPPLSINSIRRGRHIAEGGAERRKNTGQESEASPTP